MKKVFFIMSLLLGFVCSMTLVSCSDDDPVKKEQNNGGKGEQPTEDPEKNITDVAVTGPVLDYGVLYADIKGVVNLNAISASYSDAGFGICICETPNFDDGEDFWAEDLVGRTIKAHFLLEPSTKYYYATFVNVPTLSYVYWGKTYSFTTKPINKDAAVTGAVSDIGAFNAKISGTTNPKEVYAAKAEAFAGVEISKDAYFITSYRNIPANDDIEKFNVEATSLVPNTKYYYRTYLKAIYNFDKEIFINGDTQSFTTKPIDGDVVVTGDATDVGMVSAKISGSTNIKQFESSGIKPSVGIEVSEKEDFSNARKVSVTGNVEKFSVEVTSLSIETKYYYRTFLKVNINSQENYYYGEKKSFTTTPINKDAVVTGDVSDIGIVSAKIGGSTNLKQFETAGISTSVGIEVSEKENFSDARKLSVTGNVEKFNVEVSSLSLETKYYYRTYLKTNINSQESYYYGEIKSFTTTPINKDAVVTGDVSDIGMFSAKVGGSTNLKQFETAGIRTSVGIEVSEKENFYNAGQVSVTGNVEKFSVEVTFLNPETKYYYRAYLKFSLGSQVKYYYGEKKPFTTKGLDNSNHYVDLGLPSGTLWATMNVGSSKPEDYGEYFAWGETKGYNSGKTTFDWSTYKWCKGTGDTMTKYCTNGNDGNNGFTDNKTELEPEDDAAYVNWGKEWRMPTYEQLKELRDQCTWTWKRINNVEGRLVKGKNGNVIFLPAAGYRYDASIIGAGSSGGCWSRSLYSSIPGDVWSLYFNSSYVDMGGFHRCRGRSIRPVRASH